MSPVPARDRRLALLVLVAGAIFVIFWGCFADDAFIPARYAANLLHGKGLVYNEGERITTLTSPFHALLLVPFEAIFGRAIPPYAVFCSIAVTLLFWHCARRLFADAMQRAWFLALGLLFPPLLFWTGGGMETPILTALMLGLLAAWNAPKGHIVFLALASLAVLTRFDAVLLVGPAVLLVVYTRRHDARLLMAAALCALPVAAWLGFSYLYYGGILPNSFYLKDPTTFGALEIGRGALYEASFLFFLLSPLAFAFLAGARESQSRGTMPAFPHWPLALGLAIHFVYGLSAGTKHMMYLYRLFVPCVPWIAFLLVRLLPALPARRGLAVAVAVQLAWVAMIYYESLNLNITLPFVKWDPRANGVFEFGNAGARFSRRTHRVFTAQADALREHWASQPHKDPGATPRIYSITGGQPPYRLLDWYVFEDLSAYRTRCRSDILASAHYRQDVRMILPDGTFSEAAPGAPWQLVTASDTPLTSRFGKMATLRISWYYQPEPAPNLLPQTLDAPCRAGH